MIGRRIAGRYEIQERIGTGGMSLVYRAVDVVLNRPVAVKMLKHQWAEDEDVVRRFTQEARAAASLINRHVVQVFDVGQEPPDLHYIVMELVEGETLRARLDREGRLAVADALTIADQVAQALEAAHRRHLVHRDIKPQNILLAEDGIAKVTDFGIAYAATSGTLVNTGSMLGTAQYLSPEQARGKLVGSQSDLYSLGVVLFEMLTGRLPFEADSPIGVALKHLQDEAPAVSSLRPEVGPTVDAIVRRALAKDPAERYQTARALREDLARALRGEPVAAWPAEGGQRTAEPGRNRHAGGRRGKNPRRRLWAWLIALAVLLGLGGGGWYAFQRWLDVPTVAVPDVRGLSLAAAQAKLSGAGLHAAVAGRAPSRSVPKGHVLNESPPPKSPIKAGRVVDLVLSSGPLLVSVPQVEGQDVSQARLQLAATGLKVRVHAVSSNQPGGVVLSQSPRGGTMVPQGQTVTLTVSQAAPSAGQPMPSLVGLSVAQAAAELEPLNLAMSTPQTHYSTQPANTIIDQNPPPFTTLSGAPTVTVTVSGGLSPQSATALKNAGNADWQVPGSAPPRSLLKVVVTDSAGNEEVFYRQVDPGQAVSFPFTWYGQSGQVAIFLNGQQEYQTALVPTQAPPSSSPAPSPSAAATAPAKAPPAPASGSAAPSSTAPSASPAPSSPAAGTVSH